MQLGRGQQFPFVLGENVKTNGKVLRKFAAAKYPKKWQQICTTVWKYIEKYNLSEKKMLTSAKEWSHFWTLRGNFFQMLKICGFNGTTKANTTCA